MSLIIALGSNIGDSIQNLADAKKELCHHFHLVAESRIYRSTAVDYENQPDFYNQVLQFDIPTNLTPGQSMDLCLEIEKKLGRTRQVLRGPRTIDIDIIFWENAVINSNHITIPHPRWQDRSFVVRPLSELPFFQQISQWHKIPTSFTIEAFPV